MFQGAVDDCTDSLTDFSAGWKVTNGRFRELRVEVFDFEACLRVREFQFTRGSALYRDLFQFIDEIKAAKRLLQIIRNYLI
jgi:hypothetical protein